MAVFTRRSITALSSGIAFCALIASGASHAQDAQPTSDEQASASTGNEIVVTAQRREEALEDVPMAITAVSGELLENAGVTSFQDLGAVTAGAQVNFAGAFTQPSVRGVTTLTNGTTVENNIAVYVDGFYEPNPLVTNIDLPNLASIQVLKGPQGTLYGRNATGGAILINTLQPSDILTGRWEISYGRFNDKRASAYVSGPVSNSVRFGLAGYYRQSDSYIKLISRTVPGEFAGPAAPIRQASVRGKLEVDLAENLTATLGYNFVHVDDPRANLYSTFELRPATIGGQPFPGPPISITEPGTAATNLPTRGPTEAHQGTLKLAWDLGIGTLTSYTGYSKSVSDYNYDTDGTYLDLSSSKFIQTQKTFQQAIDLSVNAIGSVDLLVGAMYYRDNSGTDLSSFGSGGNLNFMNFTDQTTGALAVYADGTIHLTDALSITAGGRYSWEKKKIDFVSVNASGSTRLGPLSPEDSWSSFTPRASIRYEIAPRTNIYASYTQGFRSGAFASSPPSLASEYRAVEPEQIKAYEVGFKTANSLFRFDIAAFYYDYTNLHVSSNIRSPLCAPLPAQCGTNLTLFQNAPKAEIYGGEAQISASPLPNLNVRAGISYLHARYGEFTNATGVGFNPATNTNVPNQTQDWSNQQMTRAPSYSGNVGFDYTMPVGEAKLMIAANANFTDDYVINNPSVYGPLAGSLANIQRYRQDGYVLVNASATYTFPSGLYVGVYGRNLTDHRYFITLTGGSNGNYGSLAEPRTYGAKVGFRY